MSVPSDPSPTVAGCAGNYFPPGETLDRLYDHLIAERERLRQGGEDQVHPLGDHYARETLRVDAHAELARRSLAAWSADVDRAVRAAEKATREAREFALGMRDQKPALARFDAALERLEVRAQAFREAAVTPARRTQTGQKRGRRTKTEKSSDAMVLATLCKWHGFNADGSVTNHAPATNRGLVAFKVSGNALTRFLKRKFPEADHPCKKYQAICNKEQIGALLTLWNGDSLKRHAELRNDEQEPATKKRGQHRRGRFPGGGHRDDS
jgi:hypothetical protein